MIRDSDPENSGALIRARGAVLCRAAPSFLRFGSFELPARRGDVELVRKLADYCVRHLGPYLDPNRSMDDGDMGDDRKGRRGFPVPPCKGQELQLNEEEDYLGLLVAIVEVGPTKVGCEYSSRTNTSEDTLRSSAPSNPWTACTI